MKRFLLLLCGATLFCSLVLVAYGCMKLVRIEESDSKAVPTSGGVVRPSRPSVSRETANRVLAIGVIGAVASTVSSVVVYRRFGRRDRK